jgi:hypothetical protein
LAGECTEMSADTKSFKTDIKTDISAKILADTDTETDNFLSLIKTLNYQTQT